MLSGGEQQRVALSRALAPQPGILLMDEPFSNLDQRMRERIREETMGLLRENGATALVVTHDPVEAMMIADRIALMRGGRIEQAGAPEELYERPKSLFAARFFCDLNEIPARAVAGRIETPLGVFAAPAGFSDGPCVVCLRPGSIRPAPDGQGDGSGEVVSLRFLGESDLVTVRTSGLSAPLVMRTPPRAGPKPGESISLFVSHSHALVFSCQADSLA
jgi:iron(III) transport system ATP-binding protein